MKYNNISNTSSISSGSIGVIAAGNYYTTTGGHYSSINTNHRFRSDVDQEQLIEYIDLLYQIMGIDITFEKWCELSASEKISLIRDIKLNKIL